jgi:hypothetical protein
MIGSKEKEDHQYRVSVSEHPRAVPLQPEHDLVWSHDGRAVEKQVNVIRHNFQGDNHAIKFF